MNSVLECSITISREILLWKVRQITKHEDIENEKKTVSDTEHSTIRQLTVSAPALLVVVLFIYWVVWIIMKRFLEMTSFDLISSDHF